MTVLLSGGKVRLVNGRPYLLGTTSVSSGGGSGGTGSGGTGSTGSGGSGGSSAPSTMSQAFTVTNWGSATSPMLHKRGVWFKKGDVPAGQVPVLSGGTAQFYGLSHWSDGSLKLARMWHSDTPLSAGASRDYTITAAAGSLTGAVKAVGNTGLVSALSGHDFKVTFANVKDYQGNSYNGGSLVASLAAHSATGTRWEMLATGALADVWQGWGMASVPGGAADAHLKVNWHIARLKNSDGSTLAWRIGAAPAMDWWNVAGKTDLTYDAALADGSSTILSFAGVQHYYHSHWLMCINDGGLNAGRVPLVGVAQPTLDYTFDKTYAILANVVPPYRRDKMPNAVTQNPYVPCNVVPNDGHRTSLDAGGNYSGRGPITRYDSDAFMAQTPLFNTVSRLNALTGLSVVYHYRSSRTRTRPGEAADVANTNIPLLMAPLAAWASDFTAQGLPIAVDAYRGGTPTDGFVSPQLLSSNPWGSGSLDATHAVSYSYYQALISGEEWFVDAQLDITMNLAHQQIYGYHQQQPPWATIYNSACPTDKYTGLLGQWQDSASIRYFGWSQLIQGHGFGLLPDDHQFRSAALALRSHNGDYIQANLDYLPPDFAAAGVYHPEVGPLSSPWMVGFGAVGSYFHFMLNEDARWQRVGDHIANWAIGQAVAGRWYCWDQFRSLNRAANLPWNATTNPNIPAAQQPYIEISPDLDANGVFTQSKQINFNDIGVASPPMRNGDKVWFTQTEEGGFYNGVTIPGVAEGTVGYVINYNANGGPGLYGQANATPYPTWQVSATPGGAPMTFGGQVVTNINMPHWPQSAADPAYAVVSQPVDYLHFPYYFAWDNYIPISLTAFNMARHTGNARVTAALRDKATAFVAPNVGTNQQYYFSTFDTVAIV